MAGLQSGALGVWDVDEGAVLGTWQRVWCEEMLYQGDGTSDSDSGELPLPVFTALDAGAAKDQPVLIGMGTSKGTVVLQALPEFHLWVSRHPSSAISKFMRSPMQTIQEAKDIALNALYSSTKDVAEEASNFVKSVTSFFRFG